MHSIWWHCTSILLKVLNLELGLIRLVDEVLSSFLPLEIGVEPFAIGVRGRRRGVPFTKQHTMDFEHSLRRSYFYTARQSLFAISSVGAFPLKLL